MPRSISVNSRTDALIIVDVQNDFCPGGALAVSDGDAIIPGINEIMRHFDHIYATQDWHPSGHISFASVHDEDPFTLIALDDGREQMVWPDHCVQGTLGAALHPDLDTDFLPDCCIVRKGLDVDVDSYSGFRSNDAPEGGTRKTDLADRLRAEGVQRIFVCGLARDYCVKWTAEDGAREGFEVFVLWDLTRSVDAENDKSVRCDLEQHGVGIVSLSDIA